MEALGVRIQAIDPGLGFEFSFDNGIVMAISASGDSDLFDLVKAIVAAAPAFSHVQIVAFRQRGPVGAYKLRQPDGQELSGDDVWFRIVETQDPIVLELYIRDFPVDSPGQKQNDVYLLLDNALGEFDVVKHIGGIGWYNLPDDPAGVGLLPLAQLPTEFDLALNRH